MLGICGNLVGATVTLEAAVELCLECRSVPPPPVDGASEPPVTAAEPLFDAECIDPIVFILALLELVLDVPELVVLRIELRVPEGLSVTEDFSPVGGGRGSRRLSHPCRNAALGVIRVTGSHSRHLRMKSRNMGSSQPFSAV